MPPAATHQRPAHGEALPWLHTIAAITFLLSLAFVALTRSGDSIDLMPDPAARTRYRRFYRSLGIGMILAVVAAWLLARLSDTGWHVYVAETGGVWAFAIYWYFKTLEMRSSHADALAGRRLLRRPTYGLRDIFRTVPIERLP